MSSSPGKIIEFLMLIGRLKSTPRTGWVRRGVKKPESIADHMYRMAAMGFLLDDKIELNKNRCIKIALVHDMAECIVGDITPSDNISKQEKHRQEKSAMEHLQSLLPSHSAQEIFDLWKEYEDQSTNEAKFVKDLDKFDMILQAFEYEKSDNRPGDLQEFFDSTQGKFQHPQVQEWVEQLHKHRKHDSLNEKQNSPNNENS